MWGNIQDVFLTDKEQGAKYSVLSRKTTYMLIYVYMQYYLQIVPEN